MVLINWSINVILCYVVVFNYVLDLKFVINFLLCVFNQFGLVEKFIGVFGIWGVVLEWVIVEIIEMVLVYDFDQIVSFFRWLCD